MLQHQRAGFGELSLPRGTEITVYSYIGNVKYVADYINRDAKEVRRLLRRSGLPARRIRLHLSHVAEAVGRSRINQSMTGQLEIRRAQPSRCTFTLSRLLQRQPPRQAERRRAQSRLFRFLSMRFHFYEKVLTNSPRWVYSLGNKAELSVLTNRLRCWSIAILCVFFGVGQSLSTHYYLSEVLKYQQQGNANQRGIRDKEVRCYCRKRRQLGIMSSKDALKLPKAVRLIC